MRNIYAIYDNKAHDITMTSLPTGRHDAPQIREFTNLLLTKETTLHNHPQDYDLVAIGQLDEEGRISNTDWRVVITGAAIHAQQLAAVS